MYSCGTTVRWKIISKKKEMDVKLNKLSGTIFGANLNNSWISLEARFSHLYLFRTNHMSSNMVDMNVKCGLNIDNKYKIENIGIQIAHKYNYTQLHHIVQFHFVVSICSINLFIHFVQPKAHFWAFLFLKW